MEKNLFQEAKKTITNLMNMNDKKDDHEAVKNIIESTYHDASPEQKEQLQELEQQLRDADHLS